MFVNITNVEVFGLLDILNLTTKENVHLINVYGHCLQTRKQKKKQLDILSIYGAANMGLRNLH